MFHNDEISRNEVAIVVTRQLKQHVKRSCVIRSLLLVTRFDTEPTPLCIVQVFTPIITYAEEVKKSYVDWERFQNHDQNTVLVYFVRWLF